MLAFVAFGCLTVTTYVDPSLPGVCASTPSAEVLRGREVVSFIDVRGPRSTRNPCLAPARSQVARGAVAAVAAAACALVAHRSRTEVTT